LTSAAFITLFWLSSCRRDSGDDHLDRANLVDLAGRGFLSEAFTVRTCDWDGCDLFRIALSTGGFFRILSSTNWLNVA
jgi:hypothetical protein